MKESVSKAKMKTIAVSPGSRRYQALVVLLAGWRKHQATKMKSRSWKADTVTTRDMEPCSRLSTVQAPQIKYFVRVSPCWLAGEK